MPNVNLDDFEGLSEDVGLGSEDKKFAQTNRLDWFKGEKDRCYRVALMYFHPLQATVLAAAKVAVRAGKEAPSKEDLVKLAQNLLNKRAEELSKPVDQLQPWEILDTSNVKFRKFEANYKEGFGYVVSRLGKDGPEADAIWKTMGEVKRYFTTAIMLYPTKDRQGTVDKDNITKLYTLQPWRLGPKSYETLHSRAAAMRENGLSLASQDLILKCTNTEYQNFDIDAAGPSIWSKNKDFAYKVLGKVFPMYEKLCPFRELSTGDLKIKLGLSDGSDAETSVSDDNYADLLASV